MITTIGVLCQDRNSFGFLLGLSRRLQCNARLVEPSTGALAKSTTMTRQQAKLAIAAFRREGVDLIIRFTDADRHPWQEIQRHEKDVFGDNAGPFVCGVAVDNVEHWLALDPAYLSLRLGLSDLPILPPDQQTGAIKTAIARRGTPVSETTAELVATAPHEVFRRWLSSDESFRRFYQECRAVAMQSGCAVPNELDAPAKILPGASSAQPA